MSKEGNRIYFFTKSAPGFAKTGVYLWDEGTIHFVAPTQAAPPRTPDSNTGWRQAAVSADGRVLGFLTDEQLTGAPLGEYVQDGIKYKVTAMYVYDEASETLRCASCLPTGAATASSAALYPLVTNAPCTCSTEYRRVSCPATASACSSALPTRWSRAMSTALRMCTSMT